MILFYALEVLGRMMCLMRCEGEVLDFTCREWKGMDASLIYMGGMACEYRGKKRKFFNTD